MSSHRVCHRLGAAFSGTHTEACTPHQHKQHSTLLPLSWQRQQLPGSGTCTHTFRPTSTRTLTGDPSTRTAPLPTQHPCSYPSPSHLLQEPPTQRLLQREVWQQMHMHTPRLGQTQMLPSSRHQAHGLWAMVPLSHQHGALHSPHSLPSPSSWCGVTQRSGPGGWRLPQDYPEGRLPKRSPLEMALPSRGADIQTPPALAGWGSQTLAWLQQLASLCSTTHGAGSEITESI